MIVGVSIIDVHVFKKPFDVLIKEALNLSVIELGINKEGTNVRLHDIRKSLKIIISDKRLTREVNVEYLWSSPRQSPIVSSAIGVFFNLFEILYVFAILTLDNCTVGSKMLVKAKLHSHCGQEFVRHHGHLGAVSQICTMHVIRVFNLMLCQPLGVFVRKSMKQEADGSHVEQSIT